MTKICEYCQKPIEKATSRQKYHTECAYLKGRESSREYAKTHKAKTAAEKKKEYIKKPPPLKKVSLIPDNAPPGWSLKGKDGNQVTCEAKALGISYGKYVAACNGGYIEKLLKEMGIFPAEGLKIIKAAWKNRKQQGRCEFLKQHPITK